jgi:NAD(P)-dependent dehydrogenase (short-subunit alcohol dehydrogenase family)
MKTFQNKTVLITGGTSGIGKATALAFAKEGANVVVSGRRVAEGEEVAREITSAGGSALLLRNGLAEPVLEARWAEAGVISRDEALIVNLCAVVERTDVRNHLAWVAFCAQETPDQFIHSDRFGTGYLDRIV